VDCVRVLSAAYQGAAEPPMAAEGRDGLQRQLQPQMNANDADRSAREHPSSRVTTAKTFWNFLSHGPLRAL
jgi:hypothetical protein